MAAPSVDVNFTPAQCICPPASSLHAAYTNTDYASSLSPSYSAAGCVCRVRLTQRHGVRALANLPGTMGMELVPHR